MGYPPRLLGQGENIAFEMRPHWRSLIMPAIWLVLVVGVATFLWSALGSWLTDSSTRGPLRWIVFGVAVLLLLWFSVKPFLNWLTTQYVFSNRRIIVRTGLISRRGLDVPLNKINNVSFSKTLWDRILNCGVLDVQSAAESGSMTIAHVPNVETIQREIYRLMEEDDARRRGPETTPRTG